MMCARLAFLLPFLILTPLSAFAQSVPHATPLSAVELTGGYAGFADDATIDHGMFGGSVRFHLSPRVSVGPEIVYMIGPGGDRDFFLTGNVTFDVLSPARRWPRRVTPFFVVGGGLMVHSDRFGNESFTSNEGAFTAGGGARVWVSDRVYVASELRFGWELHFRFAGTVGITLPR